MVYIRVDSGSTYSIFEMIAATSAFGGKPDTAQAGHDFRF
jgi:hypothetical protein